MQALLIDDSRLIRAVLRSTLLELKYETLEAGNGRDGLETLRKSPDVAVVFVDWNMPEMNGLEFVRAARSDGRWARLPIVVMTTESEAAPVRAAQSEGINDIMIKPFTTNDVREVLRTHSLIAG